MLVNYNDFEELQQPTKAPAVSIIIPTHRISSERQQDYIRFKNAISEVQQQLVLQYDKKEIQSITDRLWQLLEEMDYSMLLEGLAVFISPSTEKIIDLPFPVEDRIIVDESFEVRDLLLALNKLVDYYLLSLHEDQAMLYSGKGANIKLVEDDYFPFAFDNSPNEEEKPQFTNTGVGSLQGAAEKKHTEQRKLGHFLSHIDHALTAYLNNSANPVFLAGSKEILNEFQHISQHAQHIQGSITGNFKNDSPEELADKMQPEINRYLEAIRQSALDHLEQVDRSYITAGLPQVYQQAAAGRGATLLVEKGYTTPGYLDENQYLLYLEPQQSDGLTPLKDAVDDTIELVVAKGGQVRFVDNGKLEKYDRIALIMRY